MGVSEILTRMIQLRHPGPVMEVTENVRVLLGDPLLAGDQEAPAACGVFLQSPAIGAVVCVLRSYPLCVIMCITLCMLTWARV